jgi:hypothetical protein
MTLKKNDPIIHNAWNAIRAVSNESYWPSWGSRSPRPTSTAGYQGQTDHDIDQEDLRETQDMTSAELAEVTDPPDEPDPHRCSVDPDSGTCQVCSEECVTVTWSEVVTRSATVHRSELAEAVTAAGQDDDGHSMPEKLSDLYGDPWKHGDLAALLGELTEDDHTVTEEDDADVYSIVPASESHRHTGYPS